MESRVDEGLYAKLSATELSAIIMKGGSPNSSDRDAGFCSGSSEGGDDISIDNRLEPRSPTDAFEDSVEVKLSPICFARNKRKSSEPSKVISEQQTGPLKKRIRYTSPELFTTTAKTTSTVSPFRPWDHEPRRDTRYTLPHERMPNPAEVFVRHPGVTTLHRVPYYPIQDDVQEEPLALIVRKPSPSPSTVQSESQSSHSEFTPQSSPSYPQPQNLSFSEKKKSTHQSRKSATELDSVFSSIRERLNSSPSSVTSSSSSSALKVPSVPSSNASTSSQSSSSNRPQQRNYKNMTRERRIEANARERTRVHTISAAYESLRNAIPSYSDSQKLSKLSVLRVACSYILTLSRMAGYDYSKDQSAPSLAECFAEISKIIESEGKVRKKKDE